VNKIFRTALISLGLAAPAFADELSLGEYLSQMDRTKVTFSGRIKYDSSPSSNPFTFYDENRVAFGATIDAGRDVREQVETNCRATDFSARFDELCRVSGRGTVEIRGSRVFISIEVVDSLSK
jgi:hypothetical protein